jgi:uncharacterized protein DUF6975
MASASVETAGRPAGQLLLAAVQAQGSAAHPYATCEALLKGPEAARNLADLIHFLCTLHGRYPGVIDHASRHVVAPEVRPWLAGAAYAFAGERAYLARLAVAAGPVPSTPGAGDSDSAVLGQRHAIEMLALSERNGCAVGAAMAVILDWASVRGPLDAAARRFGIEVPAFIAADGVAVAAAADGFAAASAIQRALLFGAEQILVQHFGLWDLLEARQQARG